MAASPPPVIEAHLAELRRLVELERDEEVARSAELLSGHSIQDLVQAGIALADLKPVDESGGLGGRYLVGFAPREGPVPPEAAIGVGDLVRVLRRQADPDRLVVGLVSERTAERVTVAFESPPSEAYVGAGTALVQVANDVTFRRLVQGIGALRTVRTGRPAELRAQLLDPEAPPPGFDDVPEPEWLDPVLDASQRRAVRRCLGAQVVALVHGPPGTGKTTALIEIIRQARRRGGRVLVAAASNLAVDNLVERLAAEDEPVVRLGHPARVTPALRGHTLDLLVQADEAWKLSRKLLDEVRGLMQERSRLEGRVDRGRLDHRDARPQLRRIRSEIGRGMADLRRFERLAVERVLERSEIVCATLTGCAGRTLDGRSFDWIVVDEATQATEPATYLPLLRAGEGARVILAGDHHQLPPTVVSVDAQRQGLGRTLFERIVAQWGDQVRSLLTVQYRMHAEIMAFPSERFYGGRLEAAPAVASHLLCDLPGVTRTAETSSALEVIDTSGRGLDELRTDAGESCSNPDEAALVASRARLLLEAGVRPEDLAVITPYAAQVRVLRNLLEDAGPVEIGTVDGFQGREKEAVVVSLVRSNDRGEVGFLADVRRMNVAWTRARRRLSVVGDGATLASHPFYDALFAWAQAEGVYRSAWELEW